MQIVNTNMFNNLFSSFYNKGFEFVAYTKNKVLAIHQGKAVPFTEVPEKVVGILADLMDTPNPTIDEVEAFTYKRYGGMDNQLDICANGIPSEPEYLEGESKAYFDNGVEIRCAELRVLKLIEYSDEAISEKLFISKHTVASHVATIYANMQFDESIEKINKRTSAYKWARDKGII